MALRSRPQAKEDPGWRPGAQKVRVTIAREAAGPATETEERRLGLIQRAVWNFKRANVGLVVAKALMFGRILGTELDRHACRRRDTDHGLIDTLGVHINLDRAARTRDRLEECLPERIASLRDSALAVHPHGEPLNLGAFFQNNRKRITAIARVRLGSKTLNVMVSVRTIGPFIRMGPDAELEMKAARAGFCRDEPQHLEVFVALLSWKRNWRWKPRALWRCELQYAHIGITRNIDKIGIRQMQIIVGDAARKVILKPVCEREAIEAAGSEPIEITAPECLVVVPGFVFNLGAKVPAHTANIVRRILFNGLVEAQGRDRIGAELHALCQLQQTVDESQRILRRNKNRGRIFDPPRQ